MHHRVGAGIVVKSPREIELMRSAARVVHGVLEELATLVRPGVTTLELDRRAHELITKAGGQPLFKGVVHPQAKIPFPASICASVNEEIVHGIPNDRPLQPGDIVSVDCGVRLKGYCGDAARTFKVGEVQPAIRKLLEVTEQVLDLAIERIRPGVRWSTIAKQMQAFVEAAGCGVVRDFVGHGIGREMHEKPSVPNFWDRGQREADFELVPGMTLAIEPMVTAGRPEVRVGDGTGWPMVTVDGSWAAHFEHDVAVTATGADVLSDGR